MREKIYFIPGLMTDIRLWSKAMPYLDEFEIVHTSIPNSTNFDEIVDILNKDFFKEEKINILGFSLGGYIASYFTCKYPNKVQRLFTCSATFGTTSKIELARREKKLEDFQNSKEFGLEFEKAVMLLEEQNQNNTELINIMISMFETLGREVFLTQLKSTFNRVDLFDKLKDKTIPMYMLYSSNDRLLDIEALNKLHTQKHNIKLLKREGTSHNIPLEFPELFASSIKKWIQE